jgi:hypothetical protein
MEIPLGKTQIIKAIDDGGVSVYFRTRTLLTRLIPTRSIIYRSTSTLPVSLSYSSNNFQAKCKRHAKENDEETANRHAVQIFAEMLGQVCRSNFYEDMNNEYQDVLISLILISNFS